MSYPIQLIRVGDNQLVDAVLLPLSNKHLSDFETLWKNRLAVSGEEDSHWDWVKKNRIYTSSANYDVLEPEDIEAIATDLQNRTQALVTEKIQSTQSA